MSSPKATSGFPVVRVVLRPGQRFVDGGADKRKTLASTPPCHLQRKRFAGWLACYYTADNVIVISVIVISEIVISEIVISEIVISEIVISEMEGML